jgi:hypothetical protein
VANRILILEVLHGYRYMGPGLVGRVHKPESARLEEVLEVE